MIRAVTMVEPVPPCAQHPRRKSRASCSGCGKPLCAACRTEAGGRSWCAGCRPTPEHGASAPTPGAPAALAPAAEVVAAVPSPAGDGTADRAAAARLPAGLLLLVVTLALLAAVVAASAWRTASVARDLAGRAEARPSPPSRAERAAPAAAVEVQAPSLDLRPGTTLRGSPVRLQGQAPFGELVAIRDRGRTIAVGLVVDRRFAVDDVPLAAGEHELSVVAYGAAAPAVESARVYVRYDRPAEPDAAAAATSGPPPAASPGPTAGD